MSKAELNEVNVDHRLLLKQLERCFGEDFVLPPEWRGFVKMVEEAYKASDMEQALLKNALSVNSQELSSVNRHLKEDINQLNLTKQALSKEKEFAQVTLKSISDAVIATDAEGKITYINPVAERLTGWSADAAVGQLLVHVLRIQHETPRTPREDSFIENDEFAMEIPQQGILIRQDGSKLNIESTASPMSNNDGEVIGAVFVFHNVTHASQMLSWQANHDSLTSLPNRHAFESRLEMLLGNPDDHAKQHVLCYIDLDQFKVINDTCGHVAGDQFLIQLAKVIKDNLKDRDLLARLSGDEFGVLLEHCSLDESQKAVERLRTLIQDFEFVWQNQSHKLTASIGAVYIGLFNQNFSNLLSYADAACFAAKNKGRNRIQFYEDDDVELVKLRGEMHWVNRIRKAVEEDRFILYCQPIAPIQNEEQQAHYEILVRMLSEDGSILAPGNFIPAAERYALMSSIDRWVILATFKFMAKENNGGINLSINLSGQSLSDDTFLDFILGTLDQFQVSTHRVCFEITETAAIANLGRAMHIIKTLKERGCKFSLDDFGSGLSSFAYLQNLSVDYLKIDGGFVKDMVNDAIDCAMVEAINKIGHVMGLQTVAEFVENESILAKLKDLGVDYVQGYAIAKPRPLVELITDNKT